MDAVDSVKEICKERGIPISKLEKDCGFANGYIRGLKKGSIPNDRLKVIEMYLGEQIYNTQILDNDVLYFIELKRRMDSDKFNALMTFIRSI